MGINPPSLFVQIAYASAVDGASGCSAECRTSTPPDKSPPDNSPPANNFCEPWNQSFSKMDTHAHPSVRVLLSSLQEDESTASITGYVAVITLVIPASTEVKHASFSSLYT